jgi:hypothetical protein
MVNFAGKILGGSLKYSYQGNKAEQIATGIIKSF